jgi:hypothetical protein
MATIAIALLLLLSSGWESGAELGRLSFGVAYDGLALIGGSEATLMQPFGYHRHSLNTIFLITKSSTLTGVSNLRYRSAPAYDLGRI